jgi:hypothetical protein
MGIPDSITSIFNHEIRPLERGLIVFETAAKVFDSGFGMLGSV